ISLALNSDAFACTVIFSLPPVALSTSAANWFRFSVWKLFSGYAAGRSHLVCAAAPAPRVSAASVPEKAAKRWNRVMSTPGAVRRCAMALEHRPCRAGPHRLFHGDSRTPTIVVMDSAQASTPTVGVLMLATRFPRIAGDIGHPASFPFPGRYRVVAG